MSKQILCLSLFAMMVGSSAFAESITCQPQDLKISLSHETHDSLYEVSDPVELRVTCKGRGSFALRSTVFAAPMSASLYQPLKDSDLKEFSDGHFKSLLVQHTESLMKAFLATLLTAKTSSLPVTITYDPQTNKNYSDGVKVILGVTIE